MKKIVLIVLLLAAYIAPAQTKRIDLCIKALDNKDFVIDHESKANFSVNSKAAQKLIRIGKAANEKLIEALNDPTKNIMAHWVLCQINFKTVTFAGPKSMHKDGEQVNMYYLGEEKGEGVVIFETKVNNAYKAYFDKPQIEKISAYWKKKTAGV
jgi:hypothetical protein